MSLVDYSLLAVVRYSLPTSLLSIELQLKVEQYRPLLRFLSLAVTIDATKTIAETVTEERLAPLIRKAEALSAHACLHYGGGEGSTWPYLRGQILCYLMRLALCKGRLSTFDALVSLAAGDSGDFSWIEEESSWDLLLITLEHPDDSLIKHVVERGLVSPTFTVLYRAWKGSLPSVFAAAKNYSCLSSLVSCLVRYGNLQRWVEILHPISSYLGEETLHTLWCTIGSHPVSSQRIAIVALLLSLSERIAPPTAYWEGVVRRFATQGEISTISLLPSKAKSRILSSAVTAVSLASCSALLERGVSLPSDNVPLSSLQGLTDLLRLFSADNEAVKEIKARACLTAISSVDEESMDKVLSLL